MKYLGLLFDGLGRNFLITIASMMFPLGIGILLSIFVRKSETAAKVFNWVKIPFECISIPSLLLTVYYLTAYYFYYLPNNILATIIVFSVTFICYMPSRYDRSSSFGKNLLYNGLGLFSALFKWSFVTHLIGVADLFGAARSVFGVTYQGWPYAATFVIAAGVLVVVEIGRALVKQLMK